MSEKSAPECDNRKDSRDENVGGEVILDVEDALELAELEAMLAIDSEQVRYDEEVKDQTLEAEKHPTSYSSVSPSRSRSGEISDLKHEKRSISPIEMSRLRRRRNTRSRTSKVEKTKQLPLFSADIMKLENTESTDDDLTASSSRDIDNARSQDSMDSTLSANSASSWSLSAGENPGVFAKPTPPSTLRHKNLRVYSYNPITQTRLTVPKRQFSPEPRSRKISKVSVGPRRVIETVHLSEIARMLDALEPEEFSLPSDITLKFRKRFISEAKTEAPSADVQDGKNEQDRPSESDVGVGMKDDISCFRSNTQSVATKFAPEKKEEIVKLPEELKQRRRSKRLNSDFAAKAEVISNPAALAAVKQQVVKEESPTHIEAPVSMILRGRSRRRAALIKLKRGKTCKSFAFENMTAKSTSVNASSAKISLSENSLKDSGIGSQPSLSNTSVLHTDEYGNEADDEYEEAKVEVLDSGLSVVFNDVRNEKESDGCRRTNVLHAVKDEDCDDGRDPDVIAAVINKILDVVCEACTPSVGLIIEPLRRPATSLVEAPRVPPLRIRLPRKREVRQRRPARPRDYSPPIPLSRQQRSEEMIKKRSVAAPDGIDNGTATELQQKRSVRIKEGSKRSSFGSPNSFASSKLSESSRKSAISNPILNSSPVSVDVSNSEACSSLLPEASTDIKIHESDGMVGKGEFEPNPVTLSTSEISQIGDENIFLEAFPGTGEEVESQGRLRRRRPVSYEQLYPSLFSRRRKSSTFKSSVGTEPAVNEQNNVCGTNDFEVAAQSKSGDCLMSLKSTVESKSAFSSESLVPRQQRKRGQRSIMDSKRGECKSQQPSFAKLPFDPSIYDAEDGKDQSANCDPYGGITECENDLHDGSVRKTLDDLTKEESAANTREECRPDKRARRRISSTSTRDGEPQSKSEIMESEQCIGSNTDGSIGNANTYSRRRLRIDSEGTNDSSLSTSKQPTSMSKIPLRKSSVSVDIGAIKLDGNEIAASGRLKGKRIDSNLVSETSKQKVVQRNMPYFKRIAQRRKLNPLAIGLKSRSCDNNPSFFYREILLRGEDLKKEDNGDVVVDVDSEVNAEGDDDRSDCNSSATAVAIEVSKLVPRPETENTDNMEDSDDFNNYLLTLDTAKKMFTREAPDRRRLINDMMTVISAQYCCEVASQNVLGGASMRYNTMVKNAHRLRDRAMLFTVDQRENVKWAHQLLIERLSVPMLATYINLLRFSKTTGRHMLNFLLEQNSDDKIMNKINALVQDFISEKITDPQTSAIAKTLNKRHVKNTCLITVAPNFSHVEYQSRTKSQEYMYRVLLPNVADRVEAVRLDLPLSQDLSVCEAVDYCIRLVSRKVVEVHRKYPDLKIVLVGWGTSCVINHQVVQSMPNVSAIINFAFPMNTADGPRGDVDDDILLTYCPTLFIVGDQATDCNVRELQAMATRMIAPTGVIVVGSANCNLHPSTLRLTIERFTHRTVQRALLDDVVDFLELHCASSSSHSYRLHPLKLVEVNDVDLSVLRTSSLFSSNQTKPNKFCSVLKTGEKRRPSENLSSTALKKRRITENTSSESAGRKTDAGHTSQSTTEVALSSQHSTSTAKLPATTTTGATGIPVFSRLANSDSTISTVDSAI